MSVVASAVSISMPSARIAATVQRQSSLGRKPVITHGAIGQRGEHHARGARCFCRRGRRSRFGWPGRGGFSSQPSCSLGAAQAIALGFGLGEKFVHRRRRRRLASRSVDDFAQFFNHCLRRFFQRPRDCSRRISAHIAGGPPATRVVSRKPGPANSKRRGVLRGGDIDQRGREEMRQVADQRRRFARARRGEFAAPGSRGFPKARARGEASAVVRSARA